MDAQVERQETVKLETPRVIEVVEVKEPRKKQNTTPGFDKRGNPTPLTPKQGYYLSLREKGLNQYQAVKKSGISKGYGSLLDKSMKPQVVEKFENLTNLLAKNTKKLASGKPVGEMKEIKGSDVLGALRLIKDVVLPAAGTQVNVNTAPSFFQINANPFKRKDESGD